MCVGSCDVSDGGRCRGINTDPWVKKFEGFQSCCHELLPPDFQQIRCTNRVVGSATYDSGKVSGETPYSISNSTCGVSNSSKGVWYSLRIPSDGGRLRLIGVEYKIYSQAGNVGGELSMFTGSCNKLRCATSIHGTNELDLTFWAWRHGMYLFFLSVDQKEVTEYIYEFTVSEVVAHKACEMKTCKKAKCRRGLPHFDPGDSLGLCMLDSKSARRFCSCVGCTRM